MNSEMKEADQPLLLTINDGTQEAGSHQTLLEELDRLDALKGIQRGIEAMEAGRTRPLHEFLAELQQEFGFRDAPNSNHPQTQSA